MDLRLRTMALSKKGWFFLLMFLLLVGAGADVAFDAYYEKTETVASGDLVRVDRGTIEDIVTAQGTLEPRDYVDVGAQVSGQLKKLYVDRGDQVKEGDLLAEIDPQSYESQVQADEANIAALKAQLEQQKAQAAYDALQLARAEKLVKTKAVSEQDLEEKDKIHKVSQAAVAAIEAQIKQAEANLETHKIDLGYTKIYAPMSGIVSEKNAEEGETLNAKQTTPTIVQIANLSVMTVKAQVAEADIMRLKAGMESEFVTLGSTDRKWKGTIRQILPTPETVNDVVLFNALIDVDNADGQLMNGMSTQNSFIIGRAENALLLPARALGENLSERADPEKGAAYKVRVKNKNGGVDERVIYVGLLTRTRAEVKSGLAEGEEVFVSGEEASAQKAKKKNAGPPMPGVGRL